MTAEAMLEKVADHYDLSIDVRDRLVIRFAKKTPDGKNVWVTLDGADPLLGKHKGRLRVGGATNEPVALSHYVLQWVRRNGEVYEKDCSCDTSFMLRHMDDIGSAVRRAYHWIPPEEPCYLVMDNAGGHGTRDAIIEYVNLLKDKHNVIIVHQVPCSPETNMLDLGVWCGLQAHVEKEHLHKTENRPNELARTIEGAWHSYDSFRPFAGVSRRWKKVLSIIIASNGDNILTDACRRKELVIPIVMGPPQQLEGTDEDGDADLEAFLDDAEEEAINDSSERILDYGDSSFLPLAPERQLERIEEEDESVIDF